MQNPGPVLRQLTMRDLILCIWHMRLRYIRHRFVLPRPVAFSLHTSLMMFGLIAFLPQDPSSLSIAIGGGLSFALALE
jgi:hypothetical protein